MGHSSISQPFTASQARLIGRCSVGGRLYRPPFPARQPTPIAPTPWRLYRPPLPVGNRTALAPTRSRFIRCHAVHTLLRHPAVPITNSITAALPQARLIGRCSVGGRLYRPPLRGSRPISTAPIYRQLHHPLFPARRPAPIVPTSWRLYRAPVPILRQFAVVLSQARLIGRCSVGGRLYRPPFPVGNRTALAPTRSRLIGRRSACGPRPLGMGYPPPVLARDGQRVSEADRRPLAMNCYPRRKPIGGPSVPFGTTNWTNQVRRKT